MPVSTVYLFNMTLWLVKFLCILEWNPDYYFQTFSLAHNLCNLPNGSCVQLKCTFRLQ